MFERVPGLPVFVAIVVLGLLSGAAYFHYKQPKLAAELQAQIDAAPKTPEGRLQQWHLFGGPQIHHRISKFARLSAEHPWLVTHAVADSTGGGEAYDVWGIDCAALPLEVSRVEDMTVLIELPAPRLLGRIQIPAGALEHVTVLGLEDAVPDADERLRTLALGLLDNMPGALAKDIPGASIEVRVN